MPSSANRCSWAIGDVSPVRRRRSRAVSIRDMVVFLIIPIPSGRLPDDCRQESRLQDSGQLCG